MLGSLRQGVAQLVERAVWTREAAGLSPVSLTDRAVLDSGDGLQQGRQQGQRKFIQSVWRCGYVPGHEVPRSMTSFPPVGNQMYEDIPLRDNPAFKGGLLHSDHPLPPEGTTMNIETKEVISTPTTEAKDAEVKSGAKTAPTPTESERENARPTERVHSK